MTPSFLGGAPYRIMNSRIAKTELTPQKKTRTFEQFLGMKSFIQFPPIDFQSGYPRVPLAAGPKSGSDEPLGRAVA